MKKNQLFLLFLLLSCLNVHATNKLQEYFAIFVRFIQNPAQVGEIAPLSSAAAQKLAKFLKEVPDNAEAKNFLEVGGGCGAVSEMLAKSLRPQDTLTVIEICPKLSACLIKRLKGFSNVKVYCCSILDWNPGVVYDGIVSTLPFNSLGIEFTQKVMKHFSQLAAEQCVLSYVEYPIAWQARHLYFGSYKDNFNQVQSFLAKIRKQSLIEQAIVYCNLPPVMIYHLSCNF